MKLTPSELTPKRYLVSMCSKAGSYHFLNTTTTITRPANANPATDSPITLPPENATLSASLNELRAACVVRALAWVAAFIPMNPAAIERIDPIQNATAISQ